MKPENLKIPYSWEKRSVFLQDRIWFVPPCYDRYHEFTFSGFEHPDFFGNSNPVFVEYCSGNGAWVAQKAIDNPTVNWIAIEQKFERVRKIWSKLKNHQLSNLIIICGEAMTVTKHYFPNSAVDQVFVNFPDPWPKQRHAKHRIIQSSFVNEMSRILKKEGIFTIVTDDPSFSEWVSTIVSQDTTFKNHFPDLGYTTEYGGYGTSYFEEMWRNQGKIIHYHKYFTTE